MNIKFFVSLVLLVSFLLGQISPALACGPNYSSALFTYTRHADLPLEKYTAGRIGVVPSSYGRMSLFVFYRELSGKPLSAFEQNEVKIALQTRINGVSREALAAEDSQISSNDEEPLKNWIAARASLTPDAALVEKEKYNADNYSSHENCLPDAFRTALKTLESRREQYGAGDDLLNWLKGQDAVFSNCGAKSALPESLPEAATEWLKKDRKYQIAAAHFYRDEFAEARSLFEEISKDNNSPWSPTARFMIARAKTREADQIDLGSEWNPVRTSQNAANWDKRIEIYGQAAEQLRAILNDPAMEYFHASARRLLARAAYRTNPDARRNDLAGILSNTSENRFIYHDLKDYISLLDDAQDLAEESAVARVKAEHIAAGDENYYGGDDDPIVADYNDGVKISDLSDWLITYQIPGDAAYRHAYQKWKETGAKPWLVSAISKAKLSYPGAQEVANAADAIAVGSPGFVTARYNVVRLLIENDERPVARQKLNEVKIAELPLSSVNRFMGLKAGLATNLNEYLKYAKRVPVGIFEDYDTNEADLGYDEDEETNTDDRDKALARKAWFDEDAVAFFSEKVPLSVLAEAANSPETPPNLKKLLLSMAWARALILKRGTLAQSLARQMRQHAPEYGPALSKYISTGDPVDRDAAGLIAIMRYPKIDANLPLGIGREFDAPITFDSNRGNWWCFEEEGKKRNEAYSSYWRYGHYQFSYPSIYPAFLSPQKVRENEAERKALLSSGQSATFLNKRAVEFANVHPNHRDTPEILHLAVRASRFGCTDEETVKYSKQAFQILHRRFPNSYWTQKTPYYFG